MHDAGPPWGRQKTWAEVNGSIALVTMRHRQALGKAFDAARKIRLLTGEMAPVLDSLCRRTCRHCPDPCCLRARIWFDTADLLVLHLNGLPVPEAQPVSSWSDVCRYAGPGGCRLSRGLRPWICTWYLCPPQVMLLRRWGGARKREFEGQVERMKALRKALEAEWIRVGA